jgi:hypothetical protein
MENSAARASTRDLRPPYRLPLLALGFLSLLLGLAAGVARLGWNFPLPSAELVLLHGPLMVSGFFGTVIGLERAVALGRRWAYLAPALTGLGGVALIAGAPVSAGAALIFVGSIGLVAASLAVYRTQRAVFTATLLLGAAAWAGGNLLWTMGWQVADVVPWWAGFLVLTIAGERLELSRLMPPSPRAQRLFAAGVVTLLAAMAFTTAWPHLGRELFALTLLALTIWLSRYDIARRTVRQHGLTRFIAVSLLSGYVWLAVGSVIGLLSGGMFAGAAYDATLHSVFLGFVFSMVFGHAPIIFPAVTRLAMRYHPIFYLHLGLLHLSLGARVAADIAGWQGLRMEAGVVNAVAVLLFLLNTVAAIVRARNAARAH